MKARRVFFLVAVLYLLMPGHPDSVFHGIPLGLWPLTALVVVVALWSLPGDASDLAHRSRRGSVGLATLLAAKVVLWLLVPSVGWLGWYYATGDFSGNVRHSTEFPRLAATRIDRAIMFHDDYLPAHFLNEADFNRGTRREVTDPLTVRWVGYVAPRASDAVDLSLRVRGLATVDVDGASVLEATTASGKVQRTVALAPGDREISLRYLKTRDTDPLIEFQGIGSTSGGADRIITPWPVSTWRRALIRPTAIGAQLVDAAAVLCGVFVLVPLAIGAVRDAWGRRIPAPRVLAAAMFVLFVAQGVYTVLPKAQRAETLGGGDDWLAYEARAREIIIGGPLMRFGKPLFAGEVFYYYPGYSYFLAAVHWLGGEDIATPVFVQFLLLFCTNVVVYRVAAKLFDWRVAIVAVALLIGIEQLAFIRHYTVTLLTENLYVLTVALTVAGLVDFITTGGRAPLVRAGIWAGASALVRPVMMMYFAPAILIVAIASRRQQPAWRPAARAVTLFAMCWLGVTSLATIRNYLVTGSPVFIVEAPASSFIIDNLPSTDAQVYLKAYTGGLASAARVLARMTIEHPNDMLRNTITKIGFSLGWLQWMGGNAHPELVLVSAGYVLALLLLPEARAFPTWPIHAFIVAHLAGLVLRMPSLYGYRLILPLYLFFPMFASRVGFAAAAGASRRA